MNYIDSNLKVVGTRPIRPDGVDKVTGRAMYSADTRVAGMLWAKILRSPHPHAKIVKIDTSKAKALPGVKAVVPLVASFAEWRKPAGGTALSVVVGTDPADGGLSPWDVVEGDVDDVLCFTARNDVEHFAGKYTLPNTGTVRISSPEAEIVWWAQYQDLNQDGVLTPEETASRVLHRRVLLVNPSLNVGGGAWFTLPNALSGAASYSISNQSDMQTLAQHLRQVYNEIDVSVRLVRVVPSNNQLQIHVYANSLADLTQPENRFLRHPLVLQSGGNNSLAPSPSLPFAVDTNPLSATRLELIPLSGTRLGEDVPREKWREMGGHGDRPHPRSPAAVRDGEGLVQIQMADIGADQRGRRKQGQGFAEGRSAVVAD